MVVLRIGVFVTRLHRTWLPKGRMLPSPTLLTDQYRDETNGCYVPYCRHRNGFSAQVESPYVSVSFMQDVLTCRWPSSILVLRSSSSS